MSYITDAELLALGIASNALGAIPEATRDSARASASALAGSYIGKRYKLPLTSYGDDLKRAVAHIAAYDLLALRGYNPVAGADAAIATRYVSALDWLKDVSKGTAEPVGIVDASPAVGEASPLVSSAGAPTWGDYGRRRC